MNGECPTPEDEVVTSISIAPCVSSILGKVSFEGLLWPRSLPKLYSVESE